MKTSITNPRITGVLGVLLWVGLWHFAALAINEPLYLPRPLEVLERLVTILGEKDLPIILAASTLRVLTAFAFSTLLGVGLGTLCGLHPTLENLFKPLVSLIRATPVISIIILAIVWLSSSNVPIFTGILMCFPIIWVSTVKGIQSTDPLLVEMANLYQVSSLRILHKVYLPGALPALKAGLVSALGLGFKVIAASEVLSLPRFAIGSLLHDAKVYLEIADLVAWTLIIIALSAVFEGLLEKSLALLTRSKEVNPL
ncbi:MAG: hypothetical protein AVO33_09560 [delta proteobacterium ML8_F1]|nr:MAG: hypothetical protein AVO33_09560 [delta proteobacterium ML8_F1]